jgi:hypothetical protein
LIEFLERSLSLVCKNFRLLEDFTNNSNNKA